MGLQQMQPAAHSKKTLSTRIELPSNGAVKMLDAWIRFLLHLITAYGSLEFASVCKDANAFHPGEY